MNFKSPTKFMTHPNVSTLRVEFESSAMHLSMIKQTVVLWRLLNMTALKVETEDLAMHFTYWTMVLWCLLNINSGVMISFEYDCTEGRNWSLGIVFHSDKVWCYNASWVWQYWGWNLKAGSVIHYDKLWCYDAYWIWQHWRWKLKTWQCISLW